MRAPSAERWPRTSDRSRRPRRARRDRPGRPAKPRPGEAAPAARAACARTASPRRAAAASPPNGGERVLLDREELREAGVGHIDEAVRVGPGECLVLRRALEL